MDCYFLYWCICRNVRVCYSRQLRLTVEIIIRRHVYVCWQNNGCYIRWCFCYSEDVGILKILSLLTFVVRRTYYTDLYYYYSFREKKKQSNDFKVNWSILLNCFSQNVMTNKNVIWDLRKLCYKTEPFCYLEFIRMGVDVIILIEDLPLTTKQSVPVWSYVLW